MDAWVALIGTLGGAALGLAGALWLEWERWRRSEQTRWSEARRHLYADLLALVRVYIYHADRASTHLLMLGIDPAQDEYHNTKADEELRNAREADLDIDHLVEEINLVGGKAERAVAKRLAEASRELREARPEDRQKMTAQLGAARDAFTEVARQALLRESARSGEKSGLLGRMRL